MSKVSTVTVEGFAATTPEVSTTNSGKRVAQVVVYHVRRRRNAQDQWEDAGPASVYVATMWDEQADIAAGTIAKGMPVLMWGVPEVEAFVKKDGSAGAKVKLLGATVALLPGTSPNRSPLVPDYARTGAPGVQSAWPDSEPPQTRFSDQSPFRDETPF